jgi:hypothetical protein
MGHAASACNLNLSLSVRAPAKAMRRVRSLAGWPLAPTRRSARVLVPQQGPGHRAALSSHAHARGPGGILSAALGPSLGLRTFASLSGPRAGGPAATGSGHLRPASESSQGAAAPPGA